MSRPRHPDPALASGFAALAAAARAHEAGFCAFMNTIIAAHGYGSPAGRTLDRTANALLPLASWAEDEAHRLGAPPAPPPPLPPSPPSPAAARMISAGRVRGSDRRLRPMSGEARAAVLGFLAERLELLGAASALAPVHRSPEFPPHVRRCLEAARRLHDLLAAPPAEGEEVSPEGRRGRGLVNDPDIFRRRRLAAMVREEVVRSSPHHPLPAARARAAKRGPARVGARHPGWARGSGRGGGPRPGRGAGWGRDLALPDAAGRRGVTGAARRGPRALADETELTVRGEMP